ncbi:thioredoxin-domain-containing protein [Lentinula detonsa]|uniref:Thioredoxin-domain-containing protein n=1 Tax=Lentinula detonsa TaxID=2804962 RepID=A0A9W8PBE3_9AGAR|nr:thioredoxin-domain-containing protein [Lentinula detonsa]KAJ3984814.1 thioredoxin-domain-containing protein [Lentinula detonsa]
MSITHIASVSQLNGILEKSKDKLSVIDFHATWCGPCHAIAPAFEAFSKQYTNVNFMKCDVDAARDVASLYRVSAMPTFVFLQGSTKVDQVRGANKGGLEAAIRKHSSGNTGSGAFTGKGQTLGSSGGNDAEPSTSIFSNMDPQVRVLLYLLGAYLLFWYLS